MLGLQVVKDVGRTRERRDSSGRKFKIGRGQSKSDMEGSSWTCLQDRGSVFCRIALGSLCLNKTFLFQVFGPLLNMYITTSYTELDSYSASCEIKIFILHHDHLTITGLSK